MLGVRYGGWRRQALGCRDRETGEVAVISSACLGRESTTKTLGCSAGHVLGRVVEVVDQEHGGGSEDIGPSRWQVSFCVAHR